MDSLCRRNLANKLKSTSVRITRTIEKAHSVSYLCFRLCEVYNSRSDLVKAGVGRMQESQFVIEIFSFGILGYTFRC